MKRFALGGPDSIMTDTETCSRKAHPRKASVRGAIAVAVLPLLYGALAGAIGSTAAVAAPLPLPETPYTYTVVDQDLPAALQEFGTNLGIKVNVSPEVRGRIQGRLPDLQPRAFLDRLASMFNFEWYYDGQVLYVSAVREAQSRLLVLAPIGFEQFRTALNVLKVTDERFAVTPAPGRGLVLVSGPPRFVALTEQTLAGLIAEEQAKPRPGIQPLPPARETVLTVFRGTQMSVWRNGRLEQVVGPDPRLREAENQLARQSRGEDAPSKMPASPGPAAPAAP